jgi:hypothetical protein
MRLRQKHFSAAKADEEEDEDDEEDLAGMYWDRVVDKVSNGTLTASG